MDLVKSSGTPPHHSSPRGINMYSKPSPSENPQASQGSPRTIEGPDLAPIYQSWHEFNAATAEWETVPNAAEDIPSDAPFDQTDKSTEITLATWNVEAFSPLPTKRLSAIFSRLLDEAPMPDIIFLQEVSKPMVPFLLGDERIRDGWYSSEKDTVQWRGQLFATMALLSRSRFGRLGEAAAGILGRVSRVKYGSRFGRDALCGEVFLPATKPKAAPGPPAYKRVRLVNVHLDSLAPTPPLRSRRPHQLSVAGGLLRDAGCGLVAGDFNPVLAEDQTLIEENELVDAWKAVRGEEAGYTWGVDGTEPFPPNRMDRVAVLGLRPLRMEVMHPGCVALPSSDDPLPKTEQEGNQVEGERTVPWSDHSGLKCTFSLDD